MLYGYPVDRALPALFSETQHDFLRDLHYPQVDSFGALFLPFMAVKIKSTRGTLWIAANQCAGASAACLQIIHQLNKMLAEHGCTGLVPNLCYSTAVDNNLAQLYIAWKGDDEWFNMQRAESFLLSSPEQFVAFRCRVLSILEWGRTRRLDEIRAAMDFIMQVRGRRAAGVTG